MVDNNISQQERLEKLNLTARKQINLLINDRNVNKITMMDKEGKVPLI